MAGKGKEEELPLEDNVQGQDAPPQGGGSGNASSGTASQVNTEVQIPDLSSMDKVSQFIYDNGQKASQAIQQAGEQAISEYEQNTTDLVSQIEQNNTKANDAATQLLDQIQKWEQDALAEADKKQKEADLKAQNDYRTRLFGGIAEAAASLVNLFGTTAGASNQKFQSQQDTWAQRADAAARERESKIQNLREKQRALQQQIAQTKYAHDKDSADRASQLATLKANRADGAAKMRLDVTNNAYKPIAAANEGLANLAAKNIQYQKSNYNDNQLMKLKNAQAGYDPETQKFYNPTTQKFDLPVPYSSYRTGKTNVTIAGARDALAIKAGYNSYEDYLQEKSSTERETKAQFEERKKGNKEIFDILQKLEKPENLSPDYFDNLIVSGKWNEAVRSTASMFGEDNQE